MAEPSPWVTIAKLFLDEKKKTSDIPPIDPVELAKCIRDLQSKLMEEKSVYVKMISKTNEGALDQELLEQNIRRMTDNMTLRVERKRAILRIPISREEYTYVFKW